MKRSSIIGTATRTDREGGGTRRGGIANRPRGRRPRMGRRPRGRSRRGRESPVDDRGSDRSRGRERDAEREDGAEREDSAAESRRGGTEAGSDSASDSYLVDSRHRDDEFVVVADVLDASTDDLSAGIDQRTNELVIGEDGDVFARVDLPWESPEADVALFNNGVLAVRLRPGDR